MKFLPSFVFGCLLCAQSVQAAIVWSDNFTRAALSYDYPGGTGGDDYSTVTGTTPTITASQYLTFADASGSAQYSASVLTDQFSARPAGAGDKITVTYDFRVNSLSATNSASVTRLSIMNGNIAAASEAFTIGFSYAAYGGSGNQLGFFWGTLANANPANGIGFSGGTPVSGFNFGIYDSTTAANNDTNAGWFRISYTMTEGSTGVTGSITRLDGAGAPTSDVANFNGTMGSALAWSTTGSDGIKITTGVGGTGNFDFDNISIDIVPEPSAALISLLGLGCGLVRRRR